MGKRNLDWTQDKMQRFLKEGRGMGIGENYKPWLTIQDFPSMGRVSRVFSNKTQRIHHFFSDSQTRMFYLLHWEDSVIDIREHYPLLDIGQIIEEKDGLKLEKFQDKKTGTPFVFTTTFLATIIDSKGKKDYVARSVKSSLELDKKHIIESFELERRYWESKNIDWGIVTQKDIPVIKSKNIEWVYSSLEDSNNRGIDSASREDLSNILLNQLMRKSLPIREITTKLDNQYNLDSGTGLYLFKYLIASKSIDLDMDVNIDINAIADKTIKLASKGEKERYDKTSNG